MLPTWDDTSLLSQRIPNSYGDLDMHREAGKLQLLCCN